MCYLRLEDNLLNAEMMSHQ